MEIVELIKAKLAEHQAAPLALRNSRGNMWVRKGQNGLDFSHSTLGFAVQIAICTATFAFGTHGYRRKALAAAVVSVGSQHPTHQLALA